MCGYVGSVGFQNRPGRDILAKVRHRGINSEGFYALDEVMLAHARLSIMDQSPDSAQPMQYKNYVMVFNGAVYNYSEIKQELIQKGYEFYSDVGDSEVILKAFDCWQEACLEKFNGMFSIVIFDKQRRRLFMARDRLGIKPLYYTEDQGFAFASTLQALLDFGVDTSLNLQALHHYLTFHSVVPAPNTILNGIKKFPAAHYAYYDIATKTLDIRRYWTLGTTVQSMSYEEACEAIDAKLHESVKRRLVADTEVGVLLSGGIDSSLIAALGKQYKPDIKTFSIGFESTDEEAGDEFYYSDMVADFLDTEHHQIHIDKSRVLRALPKAIGMMSEPMISHDAVAFYLLSQEVSRQVKVVQSGQGADEVFAGYHWHQKIAGNDQNWSLEEAYRQTFFDQHHKDLSQYVAEPFLSNDFSGDFIKDYFSQYQFADNLQGSLHIDTNVFLVDDPLKRVDNMTMAWSLEARVPFLDHELVELAFSVDGDYKIRHNGKGVIKDLARKYLPAEVIDRKKGYFPMPALKYIKGEFLEYIRDTLDAQVARERGLFNRKAIDRMLRDPDSALTNLRTNYLWQLAVLEIWLQEHQL
ncbi:N-acetylglutaminylglutamine amidotransferase [Thiomicrorhabdus heinhorstiae]|uniref:asparagine synthase (glutamine-hydrolyzing) n=1 Tax=Thiomicrorhabdus heinhorstiae TaxID=2748010 RepID=A0ABS0BV19_9GAMM|nr:N-acetylglutaminylglutamine amidotransferase [Thiomicrorhabdus heinhorstiae]MBF6057663.1 N-acetylglutaminylglutamine amidotransferase [Thiomicrorhabdus heinhorstiae]